MAQAREKLWKLTNGDVWWSGGPEHSLLFERSGNGYRSPQGFRGTLSGTGPYTLLLHDSGVRYEFNGDGYPLKIVDRNNNTIEFFYSFNFGENLLTSIKDTKGRVTTVHHLAGNKVDLITDPAGRQHRYEYNGTGQLITYTNPANQATRYEYGTTEPGLSGAFAPIVKITDPNGNQTRFTYMRAVDIYQPIPGILDFTSRVKTVTRVTNPSTGTGHTWSFTYNMTTNGGNTTVTDPNSHSTIYNSTSWAG